MSGRDQVPGQADPVVGEVDPYLVKNELLKVDARLKDWDFGAASLDDWLALRQRHRDLQAQLSQVRSRELDAKIAADTAAVDAALPPGPEEFDLSGMPLTQRAADWRRSQIKRDPPERPEAPDDGGIREGDAALASSTFLKHDATFAWDLVVDASTRERSIQEELMYHDAFRRSDVETIARLKAQEEQAKEDVARSIDRLRAIDPKLADEAERKHWEITHPSERAERQWQEERARARTEQEQIAALLALINASSSYDEGHAFGWNAAAAIPAPALAPPESGYDAGHRFGWRSRIGAPPTRWIALGGVFAILVAVAVPFLLGASGATSPSPVASRSGNPSAAATSNSAAAPTNPAASCVALAPEDLTFTGLPGASGATHVTADCGVLVSATSPHCRVVIGTADARGVRNPSLFDERIGFDLGANHYDVFFQASWYEPDPYVISVPGRGLFAGPAGQPRGGTAEIKMYGGSRTSPTTLGWTAESGTITFSTEADPQHPSGGGTVDMQMNGGAATAPIHISGTWHAEQPCRAS